MVKKNTRQCRVCKKKYQFNPKKRSCKNICNRCYKRKWARKHPDSVKIWAKRNPEKRREITRKYRIKNLELYRKASRKWVKNNQEKYKILYKAQNKKARDKLVILAGRPKPNRCEICGRKGTICFDHDHKTSNFRGWICRNCNSVLGLVNDTPILLDKLRRYLEQ